MRNNNRKVRINEMQAGNRKRNIFVGIISIVALLCFTFLIFAILKQVKVNKEKI